MVLDLQSRIGALKVAVVGKTGVTEQDVAEAEKELKDQVPELSILLAQLDVLPDRDNLAALQGLLTKLKL
ncbi:MAG: hypothetical protein P4K98_09770 [Bryobacteraceae bacterium]|nr:hypothetical protein [Bryobacteraceae bacterium]